MTSSTSFSGAEAPAETPSVRMPSKPAPVDLGGAVDQHRDLAAGALGHFHQAQRIGGIGRADHDHRIDLGRDGLDRFLPIGGGVADVFLVRPVDRREAPLQHGDDLAGVVHRQRRLGDEGQRLRDRAGTKASASATVSIRLMAPGGNCPIVPTTSGWPLMADQHDFVAFGEMALGLHMHLGHQRAGGIEEKHVAALGVGRHAFGHAMGRKHHRRAGIGDFAQLLDEDRALVAQPIDHIFVVHDGVAHIDRRAIFLERQLDDLDGAVDAGAKAARGAEQDVKLRPFFHIRSDAF